MHQISRYYHTVKYLKPIQVKYQLYYRIRNGIFDRKYRTPSKPPAFQKVQLAPHPHYHVQYLGENNFQFLNLKKYFDESIDWNFDQYGKLWVYHLNYFDYLHQPALTWESGRQLMDLFLEDTASRTIGFEPYPTSLRTINWIKFLALYHNFPQEIVDSIYAQYQVLRKNIEYHLLGNHLLENGLSLLFGAVLFQDENLYKLCKKILFRELDEQILKDGGHFELSPMYHIIILHRVLDAYNLLQHNQHELKDVEEQLSLVITKMINWLSTIMFKNGDIPMLNDSTYGQALEARKVLGYGVSLGFIGKKIKLKDSGYRKYEFGNFELVADVGEVGPSYQPGHAHSDTLSFVLYHQNQPIIVDRGISTYEKNTTRQLERSTASHNTVMIGDIEQSDVWGGFRVGRRARPIIIDENDISLKATHTGYDDWNTRHVRSWNISSQKLILEDSIEGSSLVATAYFHVHPDVEVRVIDENFVSLDNLNIQFSNVNIIELKPYKYGAGFNHSLPSSVLTVKFTGYLKTVFTS